jgi:hypothetical protein
VHQGGVGVSHGPKSITRSAAAADRAALFYPAALMPSVWTAPFPGPRAPL